MVSMVAMVVAMVVVVHLRKSRGVIIISWFPFSSTSLKVAK